MRYVVVLLCMVYLLVSGCAYRDYGEKRRVGVVDTEVKTLNSRSKPSLSLSYDKTSTLSAQVNTLTESQVKRREKVKYEQCWDVKRGTAGEADNPIAGLFGLAIDIAMIPFAILEAVVDPVEPGCKDWTNWGNWEAVSEPTKSLQPATGQVRFSSSDARISLASSSVASNRQGVAETRVSFQYPYLSPQQAKGLPQMPTRQVTVRATSDGASDELQLTAYDVSSYMAELERQYFQVVHLTVSDKNTRLPISKALIDIYMEDGYDLARYVKQSKIPKGLREHFLDYMFSRYGDSLKRGVYHVKTSSDGTFELLVPKKSHNMARKIELRHPDYYFREISSVRLDRQVKIEQRVPNAIFMSDLGRKVRTSTD